MTTVLQQSVNEGLRKSSQIGACRAGRRDLPVCRAPRPCERLSLRRLMAGAIKSAYDVDAWRPRCFATTRRRRERLRSAARLSEEADRSGIGAELRTDRGDPRRRAA